MKFKTLPKLVEKKEGASFLKLKDGESIEGVFRGDPYDFRNHWDKNSQRSVLCTGDSVCPYCEDKEKSRFRFRINFITKENGQLVVKIFESSRTVYEDLAALSQNYLLEKTKVSISRKGEGLKTKYVVQPVPEWKVNEKALAVIEGLKLFDLEQLDSQSEENQDSEPDFDDEGVPF